MCQITASCMSISGESCCVRSPAPPVGGRLRSRGAMGDGKGRVSSELLRGVLVLLRLASDEYSLGKKPQTTVSFLLPDQARRASYPPLPCLPASLPPTAAARA